MQKIIAALIFLLISPIYFIVSLLIYIEDGFPILYKQKRSGMNHELFGFYKFRSMKKNTPEVATHLLTNHELYMLKIGKIMRKYSLDELPNLINVVKGNIGFVGPRPALHNQHDLIGMREKLGIHRLKPGITGWAQINGRDEISIREKVKLEKYYLENKSIWLDIKIVLITLRNALTAKDVSH